MAKLEKLQWPQDHQASATLTALAFDALEILVEYIPDDKLQEAADRIDDRVSAAAKSNERNRNAIAGVEIARSAFSQIVRR